MKQYIVIWRKIDEEQGIARLSKRRRAGYGGNKMKYTLKELEQKFREQPDCTEYTASSGTEEKND